MSALQTNPLLARNERWQGVRAEDLTPLLEKAIEMDGPGLVQTISRMAEVREQGEIDGVLSRMSAAADAARGGVEKAEAEKIERFKRPGDLSSEDDLLSRLELLNADEMRLERLARVYGGSVLYALTKTAAGLKRETRARMTQRIMGDTGRELETLKRDRGRSTGVQEVPVQVIPGRDREDGELRLPASAIAGEVEAEKLTAHHSVETRNLEAALDQVRRGLGGDPIEDRYRAFSYILRGVRSIRVEDGAAEDWGNGHLPILFVNGLRVGPISRGGSPSGMKQAEAVSKLLHGGRGPLNIKISLSKGSDPFSLRGEKFFIWGIRVLP